MTMTANDEITALLAKVTQRQVKCPSCGATENLRMLWPFFWNYEATPLLDGRVVRGEDPQDEADPDRDPFLYCTNCSAGFPFDKAMIVDAWAYDMEQLKTRIETLVERRVDETNCTDDEVRDVKRWLRQYPVSAAEPLATTLRERFPKETQ